MSEDVTATTANAKPKFNITALAFNIAGGALAPISLLAGQFIGARSVIEGGPHQVSVFSSIVMIAIGLVAADKVKSWGRNGLGAAAMAAMIAGVGFIGYGTQRNQALENVAKLHTATTDMSVMCRNEQAAHPNRPIVFTHQGSSYECPTPAPVSLMLDQVCATSVDQYGKPAQRVVVGNKNGNIDTTVTVYCRPR